MSEDINDKRGNIAFVDQTKDVLGFLKTGPYEQRIIDAFSSIKDEGFVSLNTTLQNWIDPSDADTNLQTGCCIDSVPKPAVIARILQCLDVKETSSILQVGGGCGLFSAVLSKLVGGGFVTVIDSDNERLKESRRKLSNLLNVKVMKAHFARIGATFDRIVFLESITKEQESSILFFAQHHLNDGGVLVCPYVDGPLLIYLQDEDRKIVTNDSFASLPLGKVSFIQ